MKFKDFCVGVQNCCPIMAPPALLERATLRLQNCASADKADSFPNRLLRWAEFRCLASVDDTSRWHQRIFHRDYRPRKTRVPAVRSRCLLLPPAAAARSPVNSRRSLRTRVVGLSQEKQMKEKADYRMVVCFSLAPPVGL